MLSALNRSVKRHLLQALVLTFCMSPLQCATLERLTLDDMIAQSTSIVRGKVTNSFAVATGTSISTHYQIQVSEILKGTPGRTVDVTVLGGAANNMVQSLAGAPTFSTGSDYVFFLWTSRAGVTMVMGLTQGVFSVATDGSKDPMTNRAASHELMLDRGTGRPVKDEPLTMHMSELRSRISAAQVTK